MVGLSECGWWWEGSDGERVVVRGFIVEALEVGVRRGGGGGAEREVMEEERENGEEGEEVPEGVGSEREEERGERREVERERGVSRRHDW